MLARLASQRLLFGNNEGRGVVNILVVLTPLNTQIGKCLKLFY